MSFRAEILDFIGGATKISEMVRKQAETGNKADYYQAMIQNAKAKLKQSGARQGGVNARAAARLAYQQQRDAERNKRYDAQQAFRKEQADRAYGLNERRVKALEGRAAGGGDPSADDLVRGVPTGPTTGGIPAPVPAPAQAIPGPTSAAPGISQGAYGLPDAEDADAEDISAADVYDEPDDTDDENDNDVDDDYEYAEGGEVGYAAADENALPAEAPARAIPARNDAPNSPEPKAAPEKDSEATSNSYGFNMEKTLSGWGSPGGFNPVKAGMDAIQANLTARAGLPGAAGAVGSAGERLHRNEGAATNEDIKKIDKIANPDNELGHAAANIARYQVAVDYYAARGEMDKAAKVSAALLMHAKQNTELFGRSAAEKFHAGKIEEGAEDLKKAYGFIPDGKKLDYSVDPRTKKLSARILDASTGETVEELGTFSTPQVLQYAAGVANGREAMSRLMALASRDPKNRGTIAYAGQDTELPEKPKPAKPPKPEKMARFSERRDIESEIDGSMSKVYGEKGIPKEQTNLIRGVASSIRQNNQVQSEDAVKAVKELAMYDDDPNAEGPKVVATPDGNFEVALADQRRIRLSRNDVIQLGMLRDAGRKKAAIEMATRSETEKNRRVRDESFKDAYEKEFVRARKTGQGGFTQVPAARGPVINRYVEE